MKKKRRKKTNPRRIVREKREVHQFKHKAGFTDEHHLKNKSSGGSSIMSNLIQLDAYRHDALHLLFGNKTLREIIELLERVEQIKLSQKRTFKL